MESEFDIVKISKKKLKLFFFMSSNKEHINIAKPDEGLWWLSFKFQFTFSVIHKITDICRSKFGVDGGNRYF